MPAPEIPAVAEDWYAELKVAQPGDEQRGWPLRILLGAIGRPFRIIHDLVSDTDAGPGWSALVDPDRTPSPRWTGQLNGVRVTEGAPDAQQRAELRNAAGFHRGGRDAMVGAVEATLTGDRLVRILENDGSAYAITVITRTAETTDPAVTEAAARSQKPAGMLLTFIVSDAPLINEGTRTIDSATATIDTATLADIT